MEYKKRKWVIRDTNESIKMAGNKHLGYASIITIECVILRDGVLASKLYGFSNMEMERDSKIIIDCFNSEKKYIYFTLFNHSTNRGYLEACLESKYKQVLSFLHERYLLYC